MYEDSYLDAMYEDRCAAHVDESDYWTEPGFDFEEFDEEDFDDAAANGRLARFLDDADDDFEDALDAFDHTVDFGDDFYHFE